MPSIEVQRTLADAYNDDTDWSWNLFDADLDWFDPIILDLEGNGVDLTPRVDSTAFFNLDADPFKEQTAWMGRGDGMLVIDKPANGGTGVGDGNITRLDEISYSTMPGQSDMEGLKANYDTNNDNVFNALDAEWSKFRVWKDANVDALVDAGELVTLASLGITSISLVLDTQRFMLVAAINDNAIVTNRCRKTPPPTQYPHAA